MTVGRTIVRIHTGGHKIQVRRYAGALLALGLFGLAPARGEDTAQAIDPVNIHGKSVAPDAAVPTAVPAPAPTVSAPAANLPPSAAVGTTTAPVVIITQEPPPIPNPAITPPSPPLG